MNDPIGQTLSSFIHQGEREHVGARGDFSELLGAIEIAGRVVAATVRKAGLANMLGRAGAVNVQGEEVKKLDVLANEAMIAALSKSGKACVLASEEDAGIISIPGRRFGDYAVAFDPLDGSGNVDNAGALGTIFSIYRRITPASGPGAEGDLLRRGADQIAAGYMLYGSSTILVLACDGVNGFTLDPLVGSWLLTHPDLKIPRRGRSWSANPGNRAYWHPGVAKYVTGLESKDSERKRPYQQRYAGCLVADFHRVLIEGGIFMYPADTKDAAKPHGKLRLLYECAPMAFIAEMAWGSATDGKHRLLELPIRSLHQRTPLFIGSSEDVQEATEAAMNDPF